MRLRVLESDWVPFAEALCGRQDVETAGIILAERISADLLLARIGKASPGRAVVRSIPARLVVRGSTAKS